MDPMGYSGKGSTLQPPSKKQGNLKPTGQPCPPLRGRGQGPHTEGHEFHGAIVGPRQRGRHHRRGTRSRGRAPRGKSQRCRQAHGGGGWETAAWMEVFWEVLEAGPRADRYKWAVFFSRLSRMIFLPGNPSFFSAIKKGVPFHQIYNDRLRRPALYRVELQGSF